MGTYRPNDTEVHLQAGWPQNVLQIPPCTRAREKHPHWDGAPETMQLVYIMR